MNVFIVWVQASDGNVVTLRWAHPWDEFVEKVNAGAVYVPRGDSWGHTRLKMEDVLLVEP